MRRLRIAMLGAGLGRAQCWLSTLAKLSRHSDLYDFCGFCEPVPERARENEQRWGVTGYLTLPSLLDDLAPDVIVNGAPKDANSMVVGQAAKRGIHVLTEIPIAPTPAVADDLIERARAGGIKLEIAEQVYLWAEEQLKRQILADGWLGEPQRTRLWYNNKGDYHGVNGLRMLVGARVRRALGLTGRVAIPPFRSYYGDIFEQDVWDAGFLDLDNGLVCTFEDPARGRAPRRWDVEGSLGQLWGNELFIGNETEFQRFPITTETALVDGQRVLDHARVETDPPVVWESPYRAYAAADSDEVARMELLVGLHRAITTDSEPCYGAAHARHDLEVLYALRESARRDAQWVELPLTSTPLTEAVEAEFRRLYGHDPRDVDGLLKVVFQRRCALHRVTGWS